MYWYWWAWFGFVFFLVLVPMSYGWGYRQWGPPYPRYYYRRRDGALAEGPVEPVPPRGDFAAARRSAPSTLETGPAAKTWGIVGDLIWLAAFGALVWAIAAWFY